MIEYQQQAKRSVLKAKYRKDNYLSKEYISLPNASSL